MDQGGFGLVIKYIGLCVVVFGFGVKCDFVDVMICGCDQCGVKGVIELVLIDCQFFVVFGIGVGGYGVLCQEYIVQLFVV